MNWILWLLALGSMPVPSFSLMIDRILGIPARTQWKYWGIPALIAFLIALFGSLAWAPGLAELLLWGLVAGVLLTLALDIVRLIGHHVFHAFPLDMPQMFGTIALGLAPQLQRNLMAQMVRFLAEAPEDMRRPMLAERLKAMVRLPEPMRVAVVGAMQHGLAQLPEERRQSMLSTQMGLLATLPAEERRTLMAAMDAAMNGRVPPVYGQPRGLPKVPMHLVRRFMAVALPQTWQEAGVPRWKPIFLGYLWHFVIGISFAITYYLIFGQGTWSLALAWGVFIWAGMMIAMPPMMPLIRFPWPWFAIVPLLAHLAMAIPLGYIGVSLLSPAAHAASLLGALGWTP